MKKLFELFNKFLDDNDSVTFKQLKDNKKAAFDAWDVRAAFDAWDVRAADYADKAAWAALWAYWAAESDDLEDAEYYKQKAREIIEECGATT